MSLAWSSRNQPPSGKYFVFAGRAYPGVVEGKNKTNIVRADSRDREAFYRDPAVVLSDANLDAFNGTEKAPLCLEHDTRREVGWIHHSWIGDGIDRALKIIGRIPIVDSNGRPINQDVVADIKAGKYAGLSVGYGNDLSRKSGTTKLAAKKFREISLVREPFFENCRLSQVKVTASKEGTKNSEYFASLDTEDFNIEIQMSAEISSDNANTATANKPNEDPVPAHELLKQADSLKAEVESKGKEAAETAELVKQLQAQLEETKRANARFEAKDRAEREAYAKASQAELDAFLKHLEEAGSTLTEQKKKDYTATFLNPDLKDYKQDLMAMQRQTVELTASKKKFEEETAAKLKLEQEKAAALEATMAKTTQVLNHSRNAFAQAMSVRAVNQEDAKEVADKHVAITASRHLTEIMCAEPAAHELPWLQERGFSNEVDVNASSSQYGYRTSKPLPSHVPTIPEHKHLYDKNGEPELPNSMRYAVPSWFSMLTQPAVVNVDLRSAGVRASIKDETEEQRAEDWEARNMFKQAGAAQGVSIHK